MCCPPGHCIGREAVGDLASELQRDFPPIMIVPQDENNNCSLQAASCLEQPTITASGGQQAQSDHDSRCNKSAIDSILISSSDEEEEIDTNESVVERILNSGPLEALSANRAPLFRQIYCPLMMQFCNLCPAN